MCFLSAPWSNMLKWFRRSAVLGFTEQIAYKLLSGEHGDQQGVLINNAELSAYRTPVLCLSNMCYTPWLTRVWSEVTHNCIMWDWLQLLSNVTLAILNVFLFLDIIHFYCPIHAPYPYTNQIRFKKSTLSPNSYITFYFFAAAMREQWGVRPSNY